jgi:hypothetical protein
MQSQIRRVEENERDAVAKEKFKRERLRRRANRKQPRPHRKDVYKIEQQAEEEEAEEEEEECMTIDQGLRTERTRISISTQVDHATESGAHIVSMAGLDRLALL